MKVLYSFFQYAYLGIGAFFAYSAYTEYVSGGSRVWLYALMALAAVGMFFFKRYMGKKIQRNQMPK